MIKTELWLYKELQAFDLKINGPEDRTFSEVVLSNAKLTDELLQRVDQCERELGELDWRWILEPYPGYWFLAQHMYIADGTE